MIEAMKLKDIFRRKPVAANGRSGVEQGHFRGEDLPLCGL